MGLVQETDSPPILRCGWVPVSDPLYTLYHDQEWGVPVHNDRKHFEFLILEGAQAGLSWSTILRRREGYRESFADFDPEIVALYDEKKIQELLQNPNIIRNQLKIRGAVINARLFLEIQKEFGSFDHYVWQFVNGKTLQNHRKSLREVPPETEESKALSKDLKKRGFKFVGSTIMYAYMQAVGLVNDHVVSCFRYQQLCSHKRS